MISRTLSIVFGAILILVLGFFVLRSFGHILTPQTASTATKTVSEPAVMTSTSTTSTASVTQTTQTTATTTSSPSATYKNATSDQIRVTEPKAGAITSTSVRVSGQARGSWYFEASFPVKVLDANNKVIASGTAKAQGDWMTTNFVPFSLDLELPQGYTGKATVVLSKDNPSGLPQNDASVSVPISVK